MLEDNLKEKYIVSDGIKKSYGKAVAENILASQKIRLDIDKEHDPFRMLDLALLYISLISGDSAFYERNKDKLINIMCQWEDRAT